MNTCYQFNSNPRTDLLKSIFQTFNPGFYLISYLIIAVLILIVIFVILNCPDVSLTGTIRNRIKKSINNYRQFFHRILAERRRRRMNNYGYILGVMVLGNLLLFLLVPYSHDVQGIHSNAGILIFISALFLNLFMNILLVFNTTKHSRPSILIHSRIQLSIYIVLLIAVLTTASNLGSFDIHYIIRQQSLYYRHSLPKWNIIAGVFPFLQSVIYFIFTLFLVQVFRQNDRPAPFNYSELWNHSKINIEFMIVELWRYSLLGLISVIFVSVYLGGYVSPFYHVSTAAVPAHGLFWLAVKLAAFWSVMVTIYRLIPHLVEEQLLTFTYKIIIPILLISFGLSILYEYIF